ncbi:MAG: ABC transporter substrate-binding protein [Clostridiales bacterium]|nr:ABC transporter substrate-binding protein [Clostridiales bacterium]
MKKGMKRVLVIALCLMFALALSACGDSGGGAGSGGADSGAASGGGGGESGGGGGDGGGAPASDRTEILIGFAAPLTGPFAIFLDPTPWGEALCVDAINEGNGGIFIEEAGQKLPVRVIYADTESDPNKTMEAATKLVTEDKVDILVGGWTPVGTNPVSAVGERYEIPTFTFGAPEESWLEGGPYTWSFGMQFNYRLLGEDVLNMWNKLDTNKKVGYVFATDVDGTVERDLFNTLLEGTEYEIVDPGAYTVMTTDYTGIISKLKDADVEIISADMITPDFMTFWKQCHQYGYVPKVCTINKGMHYEADVAAHENDGGNGLTFSSLWDKNYPFSSPLLGLTCTEIGDKWEDENGGQFYPYSIGYDVAMYDILFDVLTRAGTLEKEGIREAFLGLDIDTVFGNLKFNENQNLVVPGIATQWVHGEKHEFEKIVVASETFPAIPAYEPIIIPYTTQ